jgi:hypothetical protein
MSVKELTPSNIILSMLKALHLTNDAVQSDKDSKNSHCVRDYIMHSESPLLNDFAVPN